MQTLDVHRAPAVQVQQLDLLGLDVVPVAPPKPYIEPPVSKPTSPTPSVKKVNPPVNHVDGLDEPEDTVTVDLESFDPNDSIERMLAKRMFLRMMWDVDGEPVESEPDLFGQVSVLSNKKGASDMQRLDALAWMFNFNPELPMVPFDWVCEQLDFDAKRVRRIFCRNCGSELKRVVSLISTVVGPVHAQLCVDKLSDHLDTTGWLVK